MITLPTFRTLAPTKEKVLWAFASFISVATLSCLGLAVSVPVQAQPVTSTVTLTKLTRQPQAAMGHIGYNGEGWSASIHDLAFTGSKLVAGYGDWNFNSDTNGGPDGRTAIRPFDLTTLKWGKMTYTGSEANDVFRTIGGSIYTPTTDPSIYGTGGFATNDGGVWHSVFPATITSAVHIFDIASLNGTKDDMWVVGSTANPAGSGNSTQGLATAWRSTDRGNTWTIMRAEGSVPANATGGIERYYGAAVFQGKIYMQAQGISPATPVRAYVKATGAWTQFPRQPLCDFSTPIVFDAKIICGKSQNQLYAYDGASTTTTYTPPVSGFIMAIHKNNGYLYVIDDLGNIVRSQHLAGPWETLRQGYWPTAAFPTSIAVYRGILYVGDSEADIWRGNLP